MNDPVDRPLSRVTAAQSHGETARLHVTGEFDLADHEQLAETLRTAVSRGHRAVEVDFSAVTFIDAGTIRVLLQCREFAAKRGCTLRIVNPTEMFLTILHATGTSELLCATVATSPATPAAGRPTVSGGRGTPCPNGARIWPTAWCGRPPAGNTAWARLGSWDGPTASGRANNSANVPKFDPRSDPRRRPHSRHAVGADRRGTACRDNIANSRQWDSVIATYAHRGAFRGGETRRASRRHQRGRMRPGLTGLLGLTPSLRATAISSRDIAAAVDRDDNEYAVPVEFVAGDHEYWNWRPNRHTVQRLRRRDSNYFTGCGIAQMSVVPMTSTDAFQHNEYSRCRPGNCPGVTQPVP